jgi:hypothetical protein
MTMPELLRCHALLISQNSRYLRALWTNVAASMRYKLKNIIWQSRCSHHQMTLPVNLRAVLESIPMIEELVLDVLWNEYDPHCTVLSYDICRRTNYLIGPTYLAMP